MTLAVGDNRHQVPQHLAVLRAADLVLTEPRGRIRVNYLNPVPIRLIYERWVSKYEDSWTAALVGLRDAVEAPSTRGRALAEHELVHSIVINAPVDATWRCGGR